ncbi:prepilin-type N-terminal cleavage/methylation domain-containing protein [bacterium]|nr:prepilin-type N-terminal cleavage/methylation domain-containing protein [bacterium]
MSFRYSRQESGFSLIEVLLVIMLISAGILPIYSLIQSGHLMLSLTRPFKPFLLMSPMLSQFTCFGSNLRSNQRIE